MANERRARPVVRFLGVVLVAVVATLIVVSKDRWIVEWHTLRLRSKDPSTVTASIEALEAHRAYRAIPALTELARRGGEARERAFRAVRSLLPGAGGRLHRRAAEELLALGLAERDDLELEGHPWGVLAAVGRHLPGAFDASVRWGI